MQCSFAKTTTGYLGWRRSVSTSIERSVRRTAGRSESVGDRIGLVGRVRSRSEHFCMEMFRSRVRWLCEQALPHLRPEPSLPSPAVVAGLAAGESSGALIAEVTNELDLSKIVAVYGRKDGRGMAAYHPAMMVRMLVYGYCRGVVSSRKIERATHEDVAFRYLAADQHPDHDSIASFRQTHLQSLAELFTQALRLCDKAGLVKLGHVAIDGTKLKANASKHKAMSYERMVEKEKQLREEVDKLLAQAAQADAT